MDEQPPPHPRRWRRLKVIGAGVCAIAVVVTFAVRSPSPVGHWDSAEGRDAYARTYAAAFEELPRPAETFDVRTDDGFVRVHRFGSTSDRTRRAGCTRPSTTSPRTASTSWGCPSVGGPPSTSPHARLRLPQPSRIGEDVLASLQMPVLAIIAGDSVMHDADDAAEVARCALPDGTVRLYPDASHAINGERPDQIAADIARLVDRD